MPDMTPLSSSLNHNPSQTMSLTNFATRKEFWKCKLEHCKQSRAKYWRLERIGENPHGFNSTSRSKNHIAKSCFKRLKRLENVHG